jgi:hypothetical protein
MLHEYSLLLRGVSWTLILAFVADSGRYGLSMRQLFAYMRQPGSLGVYGEVITDPLCSLLSWGPPLAGIGVAALAFDAWRNQRRRWPVWLGGILTVSVAVALVVFGARYFQDSLPGAAPLSSQVWWLWPLKVIGV